MPLRDILDTDHLFEINKGRFSGRGRHPAWSILHACSQHSGYDPSPRDYLANDAIDRILASGGETWLSSSFVPRLLSPNDFEEAAAAIAELCCYGAMLEAGFSMSSIPPEQVPTPDFRFSLDESRGVVEVAAKLEDLDQVDLSRQVEAGESPEGVLRSALSGKGFEANFAVREQHPLGAPDPSKAGDTTQTNAISRVCQIKGKETQFENAKPSLLWIDFRSLGPWPGVLKLEQCSPLLSANFGALCSGAIWHAFYGWKGALIFDDKTSGDFTCTDMAHEGRFARNARKPSRYAAAVICLDTSTVLFENPHANAGLTDSLRSRLTTLPRFSIPHSVIEWRRGDIEHHRDTICRAAKILKADRDQQRKRHFPARL